MRKRFIVGVVVIFALAFIIALVNQVRIGEFLPTAGGVSTEIGFLPY